MLHQTAKARKTPSARRTQATEASFSPTRAGKSFLITCGIGLLCAALAAFAAYFSPDPTALIPYLGLLASALTALAGGWISARIQGHSRLLAGVFNGCALLALMLLLSPLLRTHASGYSHLVSALLHLAVLLCSIAGACIGAGHRHKKRKRRNRR